MVVMKNMLKKHVSPSVSYQRDGGDKYFWFTFWNGIEYGTFLELGILVDYHLGIGCNFETHIFLWSKYLTLYFY